MVMHSTEEIELLNNVIKKEIKCLYELRKIILSSKEFDSIIHLIEHSKGHVIFTGMGKSGIIAKKIVASLSSTGTPSYFIHPAEASHGDLGMITTDDIVIAISNSGESKELVDIINYCKRFAIPLIGITKNPQSTLGKCVDYVLQLPNTPEADTLGLAPTCSTTATLVLGDILTVCLMARKQFSSNDFAIRHPGGKLGSVLQTVGDIMHQGSEIPVLPDNSSFDKIIVTMSDKRLGCVGFIDKKGKLVGIFTDGDLRRKMSFDLFSKVGKDLMHLNPQQISSDVLCSTALRLMNEKKITSLFVVKDGKPIGIVHIHDLLKKGAN